MNRAEVIELLAELKGEAVSVATMQSIPPWHAAGGGERLHVDNIGCMGAAASLGLGLAVAQPGRKVMVLDGDGSLLMQLGGLASVAGVGAENFYHFVFVNRVYETSGFQPIPASTRIDFAALALAAGYRTGEHFTDFAVLRERLPSLLAAPGPAMIALEIDLDLDRMPFPPTGRGGQVQALRAALTA